MNGSKRTLPSLEFVVENAYDAKRAIEAQAKFSKFDVTLDLPADNPDRIKHVLDLLRDLPRGPHCRIGARLLPSSHPFFLTQASEFISKVAHLVSYFTVPVISTDSNFCRMAGAISDLMMQFDQGPLPLHAEISRFGAYENLEKIAKAPAVEALVGNFLEPFPRGEELALIAIQNRVVAAYLTRKQFLTSKFGRARANGYERFVICGLPTTNEIPDLISLTCKVE